LSLPEPIIQVSSLTKVYGNRASPALNKLSLEIVPGEIFALLGQNGAGKSTLINILCGITKPTAGSIRIAGYDALKSSRAARAIIGLVPQELISDGHHTVWRSVAFSRGLFGKPPDRGYLTKVLQDLCLWERRDSPIMTLSGGMRRRVMIAKALAHEPRILFLDEPTAGVDVDLRRTLWNVLKSLRESGVTIILTTHYMEEAEQLADRIGVIRNGEIVLVKERNALLKALGNKRFILKLTQRLPCTPPSLTGDRWNLSPDGFELAYLLESDGKRADIGGLLRELCRHDLEIGDIETTQTSLEEIYIDLLKQSS
jgi:ABC-2 type transport system ATP-binding protein